MRPCCEGGCKGKEASKSEQKTFDINCVPCWIAVESSRHGEDMPIHTAEAHTANGKMNNGKAVRVQDEDADQMVVIIVSPIGRVVNNSMPTKATPNSANPTHTPVPSRRNRTNRNIPIS